MVGCQWAGAELPEKRKAPAVRPWGYWKSVLLREEDAGGGTIGFGNDPDLRAVPKLVCGKESPASLKSLVVCQSIFPTEVAPITACVVREIREGVLLKKRKGLQRSTHAVIE